MEVGPAFGKEPDQVDLSLSHRRHYRGLPGVRPAVDVGALSDEVLGTLRVVSHVEGSYIELTIAKRLLQLGPLPF